MLTLTYPKDIKYDQLMNVTDENLLKNFALFLHYIVTRFSSTDTDVNFQVVVGTPWGNNK